MKKTLIFLTILIFTSLFSVSVSAQGMMGNGMMGGNGDVTTESDGHTAREEAEGKIVWEKLQTEELSCEDLSDDDFGALGEYFMGQMAGNQHEAMNNMMIQMMGEEGEEQMHVALGKRMSGCEPDAPVPQNIADDGMMQMMMQMMMGGNNSMLGNWSQNPMAWGGLGSWIVSLLWIVWLVVGILAAVWLWKQIIKK